MNTNLSDVAKLIHDTQSGSQLSEKLKLYSVEPTKPHILYINTAASDPSVIAPTGIFTLSTLHAGDSEKTKADSVIASDILVWYMPAMRMFSGEFLAVLDTVHQICLPVLAFVTAIQRVGNPEVFIVKEIPLIKSRLPTLSDIIILKDGNDKSSIQSGIDLFLEKTGRAISETGWKRRHISLLSDTCWEAMSERRQLQKLLADYNEKAGIAQKGGDSVSLLVRSHVRKVFEPIHSAVDSLSDISLKIRNDAEQCGSINNIRTFVSKKLLLFRKEFSLRIEKDSADVSVSVQQWSEIATAELRRFFGSFKTSIPDLDTVIAIRGDRVQEQVAGILRLLTASLIEKYWQIEQSVSDNAISKFMTLLSKGKYVKNGLNKIIPLAAKPGEERLEFERIMGSLENSIGAAQEQMRETVRTETGRVADILRNEIDERINAGLSKIGPGIDELSNRLNRLTQAERLLEEILANARK